MFLGEKIWHMSFEEVLDAVNAEGVKVPKPNLNGMYQKLDSSGTLTITWDVKHDNESEFYKGLVQTFLSLQTLPKEHIEALRQDAEQLMRELIKQKNTCAEKIHILEAKKRTSEESYNLKKYRFYKTRTEEVINRLCNYIANTIETDALSLATSTASGISELLYIGVMAKEANPDAENEITNKFMHCTLPQHNRLLRIYHKKPNAFYNICEKWILKSAIPETTELVNGSHMLQGRADMVLRAFDFFQQKDYQLTTAILALQIEGLIRDTLVSLGADIDDPSGESISSKAELLYKKNIGFYSYEYYKFRFPLLRNKIAHGDAHKTKREDAIFTILDFCAITKDIVQSDKIPINGIVQILKSLQTQPTNNDLLFEYAKFHVLNPNLDVPAFYDLSSVETIARETIRRNEFWDWLISNIEKNPKPISDMIKLGQKIGQSFNANTQAQRYKDECVKFRAKRKSEINRIKALFQKQEV